MLKSCSKCGKIHDYYYKCTHGVKRDYTNYDNTQEAKLRHTHKWNIKSEQIKKDSNYLCAVCLDNGIYNYTVSEVAGDDGMVTYDDTIYNVTITVTLDKESNTLVASTAITANGESAQIIFNNSTKNAPIDPPKPQPDPNPNPKPEPQPKPDPKPEPKPEPKPDPQPTPTPDPIPTPDPVTLVPEPVTEPKDTDKDLDDVPQTGEPISMAAVMTAMIGAGAGLGIINRKKKDNDQ